MNMKDNWDQHWENFSLAASLNPANTFRKQLILSRIKKYTGPSLKILDIGCGQGKLVSQLILHYPKADVWNRYKL